MADNITAPEKKPRPNFVRPEKRGLGLRPGLRRPIGVRPTPKLAPKLARTIHKTEWLADAGLPVPAGTVVGVERSGPPSVVQSMMAALQETLNALDAIEHKLETIEQKLDALAGPAPRAGSIPPHP